MQGLTRINWKRLARRFGAGGFACLMLAGTAPAVAAAAKVEVLIRLSHVVAHDTPKGQMALRFKALVQARSGGRLRVEVYPDSQLYGDGEEMEALQLGAVEMLAPSLSKFGTVGIPEFEVFDLPFLFRDLAQVRCVTRGVIGRQLLQRLSRQQMVGLGFLDNGFKQMSSSHPLQTVPDFKGLHLRVQASRVLEAQMRALGAYPLVLPFGETRRALAAGVVDGAENPLSNFLTQGLAPVQRDVTLTSHGYLGYAVVSNPRFWASLDAADRTVLTQALNDALDQGNRLSAYMNQQALVTLRKDPDVHVHTLSAVQRDAMRLAVQPAYDDFEHRVGPSLLRQVQRGCAP
jgi:C4-dicarboxylate-binding protein DctP